MRFQFHPAADAELDRTVEYYERCQSGLGLKFAEEVYATIARIIEYPDVWSPMSRNTRRCLTNRFPFVGLTDPTFGVQSATILFAPHNAGGNACAHFEHLVRKPNCRLSDPAR